MERSHKCSCEVLGEPRKGGGCRARSGVHRTPRTGRSLRRPTGDSGVQGCSLSRKGDSKEGLQALEDSQAEMGLGQRRTAKVKDKDMKGSLNGLPCTGFLKLYLEIRNVLYPRWQSDYF